MMNFSYSPEQIEIKNMAMKFARNEMMPIAGELDQTGQFPREILTKAHGLGLLNSSIPTELGGTGFSTIDSCIISESLAYGCMGMNTVAMANDLALLPIIIGGNSAQKKKFIPPFIEEYKIAAFCLTEAENGSDAAGIKTTLKEKNGSYLLNGEKMWITNAGVADLFIVYATVDPKLKHKGITAVIVEADRTGIEVGKAEKKMGHKCSDTRGIRFNNVTIPKENIIGGEQKGWEIAMKTLDHSRPLVASSALGGATCAFDHATKYASERKQFGVPIGKHQAISFMIAEMGMKIEAARLLVTKAAWLLDNKQSNTLEASYAKAYATDVCMEVTSNAVQIHGGYGYSSEYPVEKLMRDAKLLQIYEGTSQIQRLVMAREIFHSSPHAFTT